MTVVLEFSSQWVEWEFQAQEIGYSRTAIVIQCEVSPVWKEKLTDLIVKYQSVFSKLNLDCGKATDFCHRIRLTDDRPFQTTLSKAFTSTLPEVERDIG